MVSICGTSPQMTALIPEGFRRSPLLSQNPEKRMWRWRWAAGIDWCCCSTWRRDAVKGRIHLYDFFWADGTPKVDGGIDREPSSSSRDRKHLHHNVLYIENSSQKKSCNIQLLLNFLLIIIAVVVIIITMMLLKVDLLCHSNICLLKLQKLSKKRF